MNKCKSCKYWQREDDGYSNRALDPIDPDTFEPMKMPFEARFCKHPELTKFEYPIASNRASVCDGSDYFAALLTGEEFGCINHEMI